MKYCKTIKTLSVICLVLLALSSCGKLNGDTEGGFSYEKPHQDAQGSGFSSFVYEEPSDGTVTINGYTGEAAFVSIPEKINEKPVTKIADGAFKNKTALQTLSLPESVISIGSEAFLGCTSLSSIEFGQNISSIGSRAFYNTPYYEGLSEPFTVIGDGVLISAKGAEAHITVPSGVKYISSAFENNTLVSSISLPEGVTVISDYSFMGCLSLTSINIPSTVTEIGSRAFAKCISLDSVSLPSSLTSLGEMAFISCAKMNTLTLSPSLKQIPKSAFQGCSSLTSVIIPNGVTEIGEMAFVKCSSLRYIEIPSSVTAIGELAISGCSEELTVKCAPGSAAKAYCDKYSINTIE